MRPLRPLIISSLLACGPAAPPSEATTDITTTSSPDSATTRTIDGPTTTAPTPSTSTSTPTDITTSTGTTLHDFIATPDGGPIDLPDCDPFAQDCPAGQKCAPWDEQGGNTWNGARCVDIIGDGAPGDPCTAPEGPVSGIDDCALGSLCWDVDEQNHGTCVAQCSGSQVAPMCPPKHGCTITAEYYLALCFPSCIPFPDDCPENSLCIPYQSSFYCEPDDRGPKAQVNESCTNTRCARDLVCLAASDASSACGQVGSCCQPYCEFPGAACPNPDQQCLSWYESWGFVPPGYETLGFCGIPE